MNGTLRVGEQLWSTVREHLFGRGEERMAYLLARVSVLGGTGTSAAWAVDFLATRSIPVPDEALRLQNGVRVEIDEGFTREVVLACYETGLSLIDLHTHPFSGDTVAFSGHDIANMRTTHGEFLAAMPPDPPRAVGSLVLGRGAVAGAYTGPHGIQLRPLRRMQILGNNLTEVALCGNNGTNDRYGPSVNPPSAPSVG